MDEVAVLRLIAEDRANEEIGAALDLPFQTVAAHNADGIRQLGVRSRAAPVHLAIAEGWVRVC